MASETIKVSARFPVSAERLYKAWLDSVEHTGFTGSRAEVEPHVGGAHSAWEGYIQGTNLELEPGRRIVQSWRSSDFPDEAPDSRLELSFVQLDDGTEVTLLHSEIPEGQGRMYEDGWVEHYLSPMSDYFSDEAPVVATLDEPEAAPAKKPAVKKAAAKKPAVKRAAAKKPAVKKAAAKKPAKKAAAKKPVKKAASTRKAAATAKRKKPAAKAGATKKPARKAAKRGGRKPASKPAKKKAAQRKSPRK